ncbi:bifunctional diguanylate cyclase/phosphodiesterase [Psychromonas arctica]|uniref:sensor domain-containing protein n=1 Tax=Psychromonas arctica TaxID=168275 RepID=UPI000A064200
MTIGFSTKSNRGKGSMDSCFIEKSVDSKELHPFQFDRASQTTSINFAYPVIDTKTDQLVAVAVAVVSLEWWSKKLESTHLPVNTVAYITDVNDKIIANYPENKALIGKSAKDIPSFSKITSAEQTQIRKDQHGYMRIFVNRKLSSEINDQAVRFIVGIPFDHELAIIDSRLSRVVIFLVGFILLITLFAVWVIRENILKPIKALEVSSKQLELGEKTDLDFVGETKELIDLQKNFSAMAKTRLEAEQQLKNSQIFLRESEASLSRHLRNTPLGSVAWDVNFICTEWNDAAQDIFGYSEQEAIGVNIIELVVMTELRNEFITHYDSLLAHQGGKQFSIPNITKDGRTIYCNWYNTLILNSLGMVTGMGAFVKDMTVDKHNRDTLNEFFKLPMNLHLIVSFDGLILKVNAGWQSILGFSSEDLLNSNVFDLLHPDDTDNTASEMMNLGAGENTYSFENRYMNKQGQYRLIMWSATASVEQQKIYAVGVDITDSRLAEDKLKLAAGVFTHAKEAIIITDQNNNIIEVNSAFTQLTGYSSDEVFGKKTNIFKSGHYSDDFYHEMWQAISYQGYWTGEIWNRCKNGNIVPHLLTISTVSDDAGKVKNFIAFYTDIAAIKAHQKQLEHIAHYDVLTNLPNRSLLADRLKQAMGLCKRNNFSLAVVFLDLDNFKAINDFHGHDVGDKLLVEISQRMQKTLRDQDTLSRFGGDEFVAVLVNLEAPEACEPLLERLLKSVSAPVAIDHLTINVSASVGVTIYPHDGVDAEQLLRHADQAMYSAKQEGKNRYHLFDMAQDIALKSLHENLLRIRAALQKHEFVLYYQPKVNMRSGEMIGVEALLRWMHPERGLLSPDDFLQIVDRHELTIIIGEWVIDSALTQISDWKKIGLHTTISVNIDALQLQQNNFVQRLSELLNAHPDVDPSSLQLEVLETSALADIKKVSKIMSDCIKLGVEFALDDFGTGYCSLTYLKQLPVDVIKIDQTFIRDMLHDPDDLSIVEGVMGLSKAFKREVIAEGVETLQHGVALLHLGCHFAQGFGIARPMPAAKLPSWVNSWRPDKTWTQVKK